ncbi:FAD-binding oxidoreductase [Sphingomonas sp. SM33]|uniref:FAD-binding oxidoreductase n=1 Tax=Sphingomonas telluris TaxID=2907998 RepID=A0ABS9VNR3_9SPHN|nr:FAD-dependent oxidoreductase [Sphingomonas telluris]MCH8616618.1 FAD-binding oxidoreductase [Sphingomonas telluris]
MQSTDIVVVGAGVIGLSVAYQLALRTSDRILVLEKGAGLGEGSTGASSAVCRFRYSRDEMVELAKDGIRAYRNWSDFLELTAPVARFHQTGVIWLGGGIGSSAEVARLQRLGVAATLLDDADVQDNFPALSPCTIPPDLLAGEPHECRSGERYILESEGGYIEPTDALQDLLTAVRNNGVEVQFGARVTGIETISDRVAGVTLADGSGYACGLVVNASGPWCNQLLAKVGLADRWPLRPTRIQMAQFDMPPHLPGSMPVCADLAGGIYFRTQGQRKHIIVGSVLPEDERETVDDPDEFDRSADDSFVRSKLHAVQHRMPSIGPLRGVRGYSGLYTMNWADVHPIVGETPLGGFFVANGCSGHGFKLAPAIGSLIAQAIAGSKHAFDTAVPRTFLSFDRRPIELAQQSVLA